MEKANCIVHKDGSLLHQVPKYNVTPAEILVLQHIHGRDAVTRVRRTQTASPGASHDEERDRLRRIYEVDESTRNIVDRIFGAYSQKLPTKFSQLESVNWEDATEEEVEVVKPLASMSDEKPSFILA